MESMIDNTHSPIPLAHSRRNNHAVSAICVSVGLPSLRHTARELPSPDAPARSPGAVLAGPRPITPRMNLSPRNDTRKR